MATHLFSRSLLARTNQTLASLIYRSLSSSAVRSPPSSVSCLLLHRLRPLASVSAELRLLLAGSPASRGFSTRATSSSLNDPNPNWSNRPPKETILLDGCDFEHWLVVMEKPEGDPTRDEIIDSYIKTLSMVVGSEEEARMKIYSVSTRCYYAFGALVSEELSYKLKELPRVRWVLPDSYLDVKNKDYGGEPFINGQAVPYDPKYHEEWIRNNARANERNRRNDRPRNFDRSRNFDRRRENMPSRDFQNAPNNSPPPGASGMGPSNLGGMPPNQNYQGGMPPPPPNANYRGGMPPPPPNPNYQGGMPPPPPQNPNYQGGMPPSPGYHGGNVPPRNMGGPPPYNSGGMPPQNMGGMPPYNQGGAPPQHSNMGGMPPPYNNMGGMPPQNNMGGMPPPPNMNQGWNGNAQSYNPSRDPETGSGGNPYSG